MFYVYVKFYVHSLVDKLKKLFWTLCFFLLKITYYKHEENVLHQKQVTCYKEVASKLSSVTLLIQRGWKLYALYSKCLRLLKNV